MERTSKPTTHMSTKGAMGSIEIALADMCCLSRVKRGRRFRAKSPPS